MAFGRARMSQVQIQAKRSTISFDIFTSKVGNHSTRKAQQRMLPIQSIKIIQILSLYMDSMMAFELEVFCCYLNSV